LKWLYENYFHMMGSFVILIFDNIKLFSIIDCNVFPVCYNSVSSFTLEKREQYASECQVAYILYRRI